MKISGKLKNTLLDLHKFFHDQIPSNDNDISSKKKTEKNVKVWQVLKMSKER